MPFSFTVAFIGSMSMAGLPPFGGFLSKELFLTSMLAFKDFDLFHFSTWGPIFLIVAWVASVFTVIYSFYFVFHTFNGKRKAEALPVKPKEAPFGMLVAPIILAAMVIVIFFIPNIVGDRPVEPAGGAMRARLYSNPSAVLGQVSAWHGLSPELWMTIGVITLGILLFATLKRWRKVYDLQPNALSLNAAY